MITCKPPISIKRYLGLFCVYRKETVHRSPDKRRRGQGDAKGHKVKQLYKLQNTNCKKQTNIKAKYNPLTTITLGISNFSSL